MTLEFLNVCIINTEYRNFPLYNEIRPWRAILRRTILSKSVIGSQQCEKSKSVIGSRKYEKCKSVTGRQQCEKSKSVIGRQQYVKCKSVIGRQQYEKCKSVIGSRKYEKWIVNIKIWQRLTTKKNICAAHKSWQYISIYIDIYWFISIYFDIYCYISIYFYIYYCISCCEL